MGIISAAMAAAGNSGVESMNQRIDQMNRQELMDKQAALNSESDKRRAELEVWKEKAIEQLKNEPVNRFQEIVNKQCGLQESGMWLLDYATDILEESLLEWDLNN